MGDKTVSAGVSSGKTYTIVAIHYECSLSFTSPKCLQKEEHTFFNYKLVQSS